MVSTIKIVLLLVVGFIFVGCANTQPNYVLDLSTSKKISDVKKFEECEGDKDVCTIVNNVEDIYINEIENKLKYSCINFWKYDNKPVDVSTKKLNVDILDVSIKENDSSTKEKSTFIEVIFYINEKNEDAGCGIQQIIKLIN